ncbi:MAG: alpha/beta fold hydrolase [Anaerolineaceae bacterium]|nr:alpha/beta fold hydrolase [Anaerolineaceae bacterium]
MKKYALLLLLLALVLIACDDEFVDEFDDPISDQADFEDEFTDEDCVEEADTAVPLPTTATTADFQFTDCPFNASGDIECGFLTVPEDRSSASSPTIELAVAIVAAPDGATAPPIVYLAGGPGGSGIDDYIADPEGWEMPFLQNRDLILLDQRGTGFSEPSLDCPEFAEADEQDNPDALCFDRLTSEGINLMAYNTQENAADVEALRQALGIEAWDLLGISYGTRLALEVMRNHPAGIRAVILDSPFPPNADTPVDEVYSFTDALAELVADCERDDSCRENYPDLENVFLDTVQRLNEDETAENFRRRSRFCPQQRL